MDSSVNLNMQFAWGEITFNVQRNLSVDRICVQFCRAAGVAQNPYQTNMLIAGYDEECGPSLYWLDYLATMHKMNIAGTGYGDCSPLLSRSKG